MKENGFLSETYETDPPCSVAVLIPCHNEEDTIEQVVDGFRKSVPDALIVVGDSASTDHTAERALEAGALLITEEKPGKGRMLKKMLELVDSYVYIICDGDATYNVSRSWEMVDRIMLNSCEMVIGSRKRAYDGQKVRPFGHFANSLVSWILKVFFGEDMEDPLSGFRACSWTFLHTMNGMSDGFQIEAEMDVHAKTRHSNVKELEVGYTERPKEHASNLKTVRDGSRILMMLLIMFMWIHPVLTGVVTAVTAGFGVHEILKRKDR